MTVLDLDMEYVRELIPLVLKGLQTTVLLFVITLIIGTIGGAVLAPMRLSRVRLLRAFSSGYIWLGRGLPVLVILFFSYYGFPRIGIDLSPLTAAVIALGLDSSAYQAEAIRAGISAVDPGQTEAAEALAMPKRHYFRTIILIQAIRIILPTYISNAILLLKATSLASVVTVSDMARVASSEIALNFRPIEVLLVIGVLYLALSSILAGLQLVLERKFALRT